MKLKTQNHYKIDVRFLVEDEEQTLTLLVNCMTPRKIQEYGELLSNPQTTFDELVQANCDLACGWENVEGEDGKPIEFSKERFRELQNDLLGLVEAIAKTIHKESEALREKNSEP